MQSHKQNNIEKNNSNSNERSLNERLNNVMKAHIYVLLCMDIIYE